MKKRSSERIQHIALWIGAILVGLSAVLYSKLASYAQNLFFSFYAKSPYLAAVLGPLMFVVATALVRKFAPDAKGSGIPQVLIAIQQGHRSDRVRDVWRSPLISLRTAFIKVLSSVFGLLGGASIGREGPTVQIAASIFAAIGRKVEKVSPNIGLPSYLTAGAAAGVAAAFNTPLAGITFAIEEMIDGAIGGFKQSMMVTVVVSGITAQAIAGDYLYFGHPSVSTPNLELAYQAILIGVVCGFLGGTFARVLANPKVTRLPKHWVIRAFICGAICAVVGIYTKSATAGSGYETAEIFLTADNMDNLNVYYPFLKIMTTSLSYLSGMAGGIFSPSLSIGAGLGVSIAKIFHFLNFKTCALMGMVAFFSGVVQAPLTAVIIVTEMTDRHILILPFLATAFIAQGIGRKLMPVPLYHCLAKKYEDG